MRKIILFFFTVLLISNNILLFVYGLSRKAAADKAVTESSASYLLDSAYVLALHDYEDTGGKEFDNREAQMWEGNAVYSVKDINEKSAFIKLKVSFKGRDYTREYVIKK